MTEVKQPSIDDEKSRQLALCRRKLTEYREVETKLKELRKRVCHLFHFSSIYLLVNFPGE
jgi:hypothetical protein